MNTKDPTPKQLGNTDPDVPPPDLTYSSPMECDGLTSIPLGAKLEPTEDSMIFETEPWSVRQEFREPWPPLSREQVVQLHEALVAWRRAEERVSRYNRAAYNARHPQNVDDLLLSLLVRLGIGAPPLPRTWTHEEVAKMTEEVQK